MDLIQNQFIDNTILICGKDESHSKYLELLFENKKRTGGEDMLEFYWDKSLNQYVIVYKDKNIVEDVLSHGNITYNNEQFLPLRIDKTKFIIENMDQRLEKDILYLYVENLLQDTAHYKSSIEQLFNDFFLVTCDKPIDFDKLKERFSRHNTIQNRDLALHLVAKLNSTESSIFKNLEYRNLYFGLIDQQTRNSSNSSEESNEPVSELNDEGFIEICPKKRNGVILIQDEEASSPNEATNNAPNRTATPFRIKILEDRIKYLEEKLKTYENLKTTLVKINSLSQECVNNLNRTQAHSKLTSLQFSSGNNSAAAVPASSYNLASVLNNTRINDIDTYHETRTTFRNKPFQDLRTRMKNFRREEPKENEQRRLETLNSRLRHEIAKHEMRQNQMFQPIRRPAVPDRFKLNLDTNNRASTAYPTSAFEIGKRFANFTSVSPPLPLNFRDYQPSISPPSIRVEDRSRGHGIVVEDTRTSSSSRESSPSTERNSNGEAFYMEPVLYRSLSIDAGLSDSMINRFPIIKYKQPKSAFKSVSDKEDASKQTSCLICLEQLVENEEVRLLSCFHQFHVNCIDKWLREKSICPCCKSGLRKSLISNY